MIKHIQNKIPNAAYYVLLILAVVSPMFVFAQTTISSSPVCNTLFAGNIDTLKDIIDYGICLISRSVIPLLFVVAIAVFVWGVIQYFLNPNNAKDRTTARQYIMWALIGMFVLVSISGLVEILRVTFGVTSSPIPLLPETQ